MPIIDLCANPSDAPQSLLHYKDDLKSENAGVVDEQDTVEVGTESGCLSVTAEKFVADAGGDFSIYGDTPQALLQAIGNASGGKPVAPSLLLLTAYMIVPGPVREGIGQAQDQAQNLLEGLKRFLR